MNCRESLEYIAALPKNKNADLFISIHSNVTAKARKEKIRHPAPVFRFIFREIQVMYMKAL